jgi:hypothetical protein
MRIHSVILLTAAFAATACAQRPSPAAEASVTIAGKKITINYSAPSVRGRKIFAEDGILKSDSTYPVWRAGANEATALDTAGDLTIGDLKVPAGKYTLFVLLDKTGWKLIVNKQTGQGGLDYDAKQDFGRVAMKMGKPAAMVETYKMTLSSPGGNRGHLTLEWENTSASVDFTVK